jgi:hypothetical protein
MRMSTVSKESKEYTVTTSDNPYDPFDEFREWYQFDVDHGYHTCSLLGRIVHTSEALSELDQDQAIQYAIDEVISENITGMYIKFERKEED